MAFVAEKPSYSRGSCNVHEEAEESLTVYCKPVRLYEILHERAKKHPSFLQRCLWYKLEEKHTRRVVKPSKVTFYYKYFNNTQEKIEVIEGYGCPFCVENCACYTGLRSHLLASHDLFEYEFLVFQNIEDVIVFPKTNSDILGKMVDPGKDVFSFCHKPLMRRGNEVGPHALVPYESSVVNGLRGPSECMERMDRVLCGRNVEYASQSEPGSNIASTVPLPIVKRRRIASKR